MSKYPLGRDESADFVSFMKLIGNHPEPQDWARAFFDGYFQLDHKNVLALRKSMTKLGVNPEPDGLLLFQVEKTLFMQVSDRTWLRLIFDPSLLKDYYLERFLQKCDVDLKGILWFHDQLSISTASPEEGSHVCPKCKSRFTDRDGKFANTFGTRGWSSFGE